MEKQVRTSRDFDRRQVDGPLSRMARYVAFGGGLATVAMMAHISIDVFLKFLFNAPLDGALEIVSYYYMVAIVFLPIAYIDWVRKAITVDIFFDMFPSWLKTCAVFVTLVGMAIAYSGFAYLSFLDALSFMARDEFAMGSSMVSIWPARFVLVLGVSLAAIVSIYQLLLFVSGRDRASWQAVALKVEE